MLFLVWAAELDQYVFQDTQLEGLSKDIFSKLTSSCFIFNFLFYNSFPAGSASKDLPMMQKTWVQSLGWEDPLEKGIATHSSILPGEFHG